MRNIIYNMLFVCLSAIGFGACADQTIGYLNIEDAGYSVDTMLVRIELDETEPIYNPKILDSWEDMKDSYTWEEFISLVPIRPIYVVEEGLDFRRGKFNIPWQSIAMEGIEGTKPIYLSIDKVKGSNATEAEKLKTLLDVAGDGTLRLDLKHNIAPGKYKISILFTNEGYSKVLEDCYTFIVIQNKNSELPDE